MISRVLAAIIFAGFVVAAAVVLCVFAPFAAAQNSGGPDAQKPQLDYEFFKTRVEPIFLKKRSDDHARCYVCHQVMRHGGGPLSLEMLPPAASFWTEEQSRRNFEVVSNLVVPGDPSRSLFLRMPMAPEAVGPPVTHTAAHQFRSQCDPPWNNLH